MSPPPQPKGEALRDLLRAAADHAAGYHEGVDLRPIRSEVAPPAMPARLDTRLPDGPEDPREVLDELVAAVEPGTIAMSSRRFFGFVIGGVLPASLAADWMVSAWDQVAGLAGPSPGVLAVEDLAGRWLADLLNLPPDASFALVTGCQMAHVTALAAARHRVLADAGHDVERDGLASAPPLRVIAGEERHVTLDRALRLLGIGTNALELVPADETGAMEAQALEQVLARRGGPAIVCAQAGNVNTGAVDPLAAICDAAAEHGAWVHVDGAFGLWAAASPRRRALLAGVERAHSWATDAHKWLNVPYDCGVAFVADREAHRAAISVTASYLEHGGADGPRDAMDWTPEFSRRARGLPVWAALRSLGRSGVAELVDRLCDCAERFAARLCEEDEVEVLASGLNQVLVRIGDDDERTDALVHDIQAEGTAWMSGTTWRGRRCMRISVCNWKTSFDDVDQTVGVIRTLLHAPPR